MDGDETSRVAAEPRSPPHRSPERPSEVPSEVSPLRPLLAAAVVLLAVASLLAWQRGRVPTEGAVAQVMALERPTGPVPGSPGPPAAPSPSPTAALRDRLAAADVPLRGAGEDVTGQVLLVAAEDPAGLVGAAAAARRTGRQVLQLEPDGAGWESAVDAEEVIVVGGPERIPSTVEAALEATVPVVRRASGLEDAGTLAALARLTGADGEPTLVPASDPLSALDRALEADGPVLLGDEGAHPHETHRWMALEGREPAGPAQVRGTWVHLFDDSLKSREGIEEVLDRAVRANLNTVFVQVARRQDAYYRSSVLPRTTDPSMDPGLDVLDAVVDGARARGLQVHAWFAVVQAYHGTYADRPAPDGWVWSEHGPDSDDPWVTEPHPAARERLGYPQAYRTYPYLDLGVPAVQDHIAATLTEVARRYDVDAIHLDYLRYPGADWGYHPVALTRFAADTGRDRGALPAPTDPEWSAWRRAQVTQLLRRIRTDLEAAAPRVGISAAVIAQGAPPTGRDGFAATVAYDDKQQDWATWAEEGLVDLTIPMAYFDERRYADRYDGWVRFTGALDATTAIGQGSWLNTTAASGSQVAEALSATRGVVLYSYQQDTWCPDGRTDLGEACRPEEPHLSLWSRLAVGPFTVPAPPLP